MPSSLNIRQALSKIAGGDLTLNNKQELIDLIKFLGGSSAKESDNSGGAYVDFDVVRKRQKELGLSDENLAALEKVAKHVNSRNQQSLKLFLSVNDFVYNNPTYSRGINSEQQQALFGMAAQSNSQAARVNTGTTPATELAKDALQDLKTRMQQAVDSGNLSAVQAQGAKDLIFQANDALQAAAGSHLTEQHNSILLAAFLRGTVDGMASPAHSSAKELATQPLQDLKARMQQAIDSGKLSAVQAQAAKDLISQADDALQALANNQVSDRHNSILLAAFLRGTI